MSTTRAPYQPDARTLLGFIEPFRGHTEAPRWDDFPTVAEAMVAELKFAEARGLAVGLVESGYVEVPFTYTVDEALNAAYRKASAELENAGLDAALETAGFPKENVDVQH